MSVCSPPPEINTNGDRNEPSSRPSLRVVYYTCITSLFVDMNLSMLIAFFPKECVLRGLQVYQVGILFGIFHLFSLLTCLLVAPKVIRKIPCASTYMLTYGTFAQACVAFGFGFMGQIQSWLPFFLACLGMRALQGILAGVCEAASMDLIKRKLSDVDMIDESVTWVESAKTLGVMIGPILGGAFNRKFGFKAPFMVLGALLLGIAFFMIIVPLPKDHERLIEPTSNWEYTKEVLSSPIVNLLLVIIILAACSITFLEPTLQPFLGSYPYDLDEIEVGLTYGLLILTYGFTAGLSKPLASWIGNLASFVVGFILLGFGYCIIGPSSRFHGPLTIFSFLYQSDSHVATVIFLTGMGMIGSGAGISLYPIRSMLMIESKDKGIGSVDSNLIITSMINIGYSSGAIIGPIVGTVLAQHMGFPRASTLFGLCVIASTGLVSLVVLIIRGCRLDNDGDTMFETMETSLLTEHASRRQTIETDAV